MKNESLGKSFYSLSFNFHKVLNFTQFHSSNQTINQNYLFNITFQNLEFWDVTGKSLSLGIPKAPQGNIKLQPRA